MASYLVSISIGPVQDFIAQARRSRDLWFGSHLLSEIARGAARCIAERGGELIFPALERGDAELEPCDGMTRPNQASSSPLAVSNKLLFRAMDSEAAQVCVFAARDGAQNRWRTLTENARQNADRLVEWPEVNAIWKEQVEGILEFYAAAAPVTPQTFGSVRDLLEKQLAARKNLREFGQFEHHRPGAPKSSFDGSRVSVLRPPKQSESARRQFRIPQSEHLDAVGVVKRTGGRPEQFVPIANVAAAPWLHAIRGQTGIGDSVMQLESTMLSGAYRDIFGRVERTDLPAGRTFRSDAQVLLDGRLEALLIETDQFQSVRELDTDPTYRDLKVRIQTITKAAKSSPYPYVAALVADGDRMGAALQLLADENQLRRFSMKLSEFATRARRIVEQDNMGSLLYAGGDDVVAFLPLATAIQCAAELRTAFIELMSPGQALPENWRANDPRRGCPTLSVGIGIGHILTGMGNLLEFGRLAERTAKGSALPNELQRNALAILVDKRSGGQSCWRSQWPSDGRASPIEIIEAAIDRVAGGKESSVLPAAKLAEVRRDLRRFPDSVDQSTSGVWADIVRKDVLRTLGRASTGTHSQETDGRQSAASAGHLSQSQRFGLDLSTDDYQQIRHRIDQWATLHLIAREINRGRLASQRDESEASG